MSRASKQWALKLESLLWHVHEFDEAKPYNWVNFVSELCIAVRRKQKLDKLDALVRLGCKDPETLVTILPRRPRLRLMKLLVMPETERSRLASVPPGVSTWQLHPMGVKR